MIDFIERINNTFKASIETKRKTLQFTLPTIVEAAKLMAKCLHDQGKILACGNGGSASDAQHFSAELLNRFEMERPPLAAIALNVDSSTLTAIANDYDYSQVFSKQIKALGKKGDILFVISTSGNSQNIVNAIYAAQNAGLSIILLSGKNGGKAAQVLRDGDIEIRVPENVTARIQETHILLIHCLCDIIDVQLFG